MALVGANNAGKSNILRALHLALGRDWLSVTSFNEEDVWSRSPELDITIEVEFEDPLVYRRFKAGPDTAIHGVRILYGRYKIGDRKGERRLEQSCFGKGGSPAQVPKSAFKKGLPPSFEPLTSIPPDVREQMPAVYLRSFRPLSSHLPAVRGSLLRPLIDDVIDDFRDPANLVDAPQKDGKTREIPRVQRFEQFATAAMQLLRTPVFASLEDSIKRRALQLLGFDPASESDKLDFRFTPFEVDDLYRSLALSVQEQGFTLPATELGEGFQNAIVIAILQAYEEQRKKGSVLLIEEPEMFLHPQMQRSLYRSLRAISAKNQIIYTTHSPHFVAIPEYDDIGVVRRGAEGTTVVRSALPADGKRTERLRKELDPERSELFFAQRVLVVEGDTEKLALPAYAERLGFDLDRAGATIVEVGGKRNLELVADVAISFGIPTGILFDVDSSDFSSGRRDEEAQLNARLKSHESADQTTRAWGLETNYEDVLRRSLGEAEYIALCNELGGHSKAVRARLIATSDTPIPEILVDVLRWLSGAIPEPPGRRVTSSAEA